MKTKHIVIIVVVSLVILFFGSLGKRGISRIHRLTNERDQIRAFNEKTRNGNQRLKEEIFALKRDTKYIEEIARLELGLAKEDEIIYEFVNAENE